jgi:hypothetical protein
MGSDFVFAPASNKVALALEKQSEGAFKYFAAVFEVSISHVEIQRGIKKRTDSRVYHAIFATRLIGLLFVVTGGLTFHRGVLDLLHVSDTPSPDENKDHSKKSHMVSHVETRLSWIFVG